jgi:hypothetical protein
VALISGLRSHLVEAPEGRIDVFAHELGHVFGLGHNDLGAGGALNLMTTGGSRTLPTTIGDLFPDGAQLDQLNVFVHDAKRQDSARVLDAEESVLACRASVESVDMLRQ